MKRIYPWLVVLAGIAGAILRGTQLCYGYEKSGLPKDGYLALPVLTAVVLIGCVILSRFYRNARPFETTFYAPAPQRAAGILIGVLTAAVGLGGILSVPEQLEEEISEFYEVIQPGSLIVAATYAQWILCVLTGISIAAIAAGQNGAQRGRVYATCTVVPMFWAGVTMVMIYHANSGNPVQTAFVYELLLCAAVMAAFYGIAGFFYSDGSAARFMMYGGAAVYLGLTAVGGRIDAWLFGAGNVEITAMWQQAALGLCALFVLPLLFSVPSRLGGQEE